jgi:hypothetical protein
MTIQVQYQCHSKISCSYTWISSHILGWNMYRKLKNLLVSSCFDEARIIHWNMLQPWNCKSLLQLQKTKEKKTRAFNRYCKPVPTSKYVLQARRSRFEPRWGEILNLPNPSGRTRQWGLLSLWQKWAMEVLKKKKNVSGEYCTIPPPQINKISDILHIEKKLPDWWGNSEDVTWCTFLIG